MARDNVTKKINRVAAGTIVLAETLREFLEVSGIEVQSIYERLARLEELVYQSITAEQMEDFGLCYLGIKGADTAPTNDRPTPETDRAEALQL